MTMVYFVRHAEPNYKNHDDLSRELTPKGLIDRELVTNYLMDKDIDVVFSSPFKRSYDTIAQFAEAKGLDILVADDFRERKVSSIWVDDFSSFSRQQWADFSYKLPGGECLDEVQRRNIAQLEEVLDAYPGKRIVIGSHGTAMSTIYHYYDPSFTHVEFERIRKVMPWIVKFTFEGKNCVDIQEVPLPFTGKP